MISAMTCIIYFEVGSVCILCSMANDIEYHVDCINISVIATGDQMNFMNQFNALIQFHSNAKQLSNDCGDVCF